MVRASSAAYGQWKFPVTMRTAPTVGASNIASSGAFGAHWGSSDTYNDSFGTIFGVSPDTAMLTIGVSGATVGYSGWISIETGKTTSYVDASAEL